jgi:hypothetical protein
MIVNKGQQVAKVLDPSARDHFGRFSHNAMFPVEKPAPKASRRGNLAHSGQRQPGLEDAKCRS